VPHLIDDFSFFPFFERTIDTRLFAPQVHHRILIFERFVSISTVLSLFLGSTFGSRTKFKKLKEITLKASLIKNRISQVNTVVSANLKG
jgi:hypothetical protein